RGGAAPRRAGEGGGRRGRGREEAELVGPLPALPRGEEQAADAGRVGGVLLAGGAATLRPGPIADPADGARPSAVRLLADDRLRRLRPRAVDDDVLPEPAPLPAPAPVADAGGDDDDVAVGRRRPDRAAAGPRRLPAPAVCRIPVVGHR